MDNIIDDKALEAIQAICDAPNSRSQLFRLGSSGHSNGVRHLFDSSSEVAQFSVEPASDYDLSEIMKVIKEYKVDFAVKSGGHTSNPRFSSTEGIQISMSRFTKLSLVEVEREKHLIVGAGCTFDEIYRYIQPKGSNIVGGGGSVGIGGWMLGGGYSHKTNQFGLGIDNLVQAKIVLPDGTRLIASETVNEELFWAIKGGGNNFGIVYEFVLRAHSQPEGLVYAGLLNYKYPEVSINNKIEQVKKTIVAFMENTTDPKANMEAAFRFVLTPKGKIESSLVILGFYDDKRPAPDPFQGFIDIGADDGELKNWT